VKDVAATAKIIVDQAKSNKAEEMLGKLQALQTLANSVVERTEAVCLQAQVDADGRLERSLADNLGKDEERSQLPELPTDPKHLQARADIACYGAENNQHQTFKIQVRAICDLALELCFTAAAEAGHDYPSDTGYWQRN